MIDPKQKASEQIARKIDQIKLILKECTAIADEHTLYFKFNPMDVYGAGASYMGKPGLSKDWASSENCSDEDDYFGWSSSSQGC